MKSPRQQQRVNSVVFIKPKVNNNQPQPTPLAKLYPQYTKKHPKTLKLGRMMRFDAQNIDSSTTVSNILGKQSEYSTPSGVKEFLYNHTVEKTRYHSAVIIQRTWRRYRALQKLFRYLRFSHRLVLKQHKFVFYSWMIRLTPPANVAKRIYNNLTTFIANEKFKIIGPLKLATFDEFMKTNYIFIRKDLDVNKIFRFVKIMNRSAMRRILYCWSEYSVDQITMKRCGMKANILWKYRLRFGFEFVAFYFWKNWAHFHKNKKFNLVLERHMYVPEWGYFRARKETKHRLIREAMKYRRQAILHRAIIALNENSLYEIKLNKKFNNCQLIFMRTTMKKSVKAIKYNVIFRKFDRGILKRTIREWYNTIDKEILQKSMGGVFRTRNDLKILKTVFHEWTQFSNIEMIRFIHLISSVRENELKALKIIYPLLKDNIHYIVAEAFYKWKHLIIMEKRARRFVHWSFKHATKKDFYTYVLDIFKENTGRITNYSNFWPFKYEGDKNFMPHHRQVTGKSGKNQRFWKKLRKLMQSETKLTLSYHGPTVSNTLAAIKNINKYKVNGEWANTATSDQVKSLFYRIILAATHKSMLLPPPRTENDINQELEVFKIRNDLTSFAKASQFRLNLENQEVERRIQRAFWERRDSDQLMSLAVHDAAFVFQTSWPAPFSLNPDPTTLRTEETPIDSSGIPKLNLTFKEHEIDPNKPIEEHPYLQPINVLKSKILSNNRKYLRKPEEVFMEQSKPTLSIMTAQIPSKSKKTTKSKENRADYESHVSVTQYPEITNMLVERDFQIYELQKLKISAKKEKMKRTRTEDLNILTEISKPKARNKTIDPNLAAALAKAQKRDEEKRKQEERKRKELQEQLELQRQLEEEQRILEQQQLLQQQQHEAITASIIKGIMLARICPQYLNDPSYLVMTQKQRIEMHVQKFFEILNFILFGSLSPFENVDMEQLHKRLFYTINQIPKAPKKKKKKKRKGKILAQKKFVPQNKIVKSKLTTNSLNEQSEDNQPRSRSPSPSHKAPLKGKKLLKKLNKIVFPEIFPLTLPVVREEMIIKIFGMLILNENHANLKSSSSDLLSLDLLLQHVNAFLLIEGNQDEVIAHLKREMQWVPSSSNEIQEILDSFLKMRHIEDPNKDDDGKIEDNKDDSKTPEKEEKNEPQTLDLFSNVKPRPKRKTLMPDHKLDKEPQPKLAHPIARKKKKPASSTIPLIRKKFIFATDIIGTALTIAEFLHPYVAIHYEKAGMDDIDSFINFDELRLAINSKNNLTTPHVVPENGEKIEPPKPQKGNNKEKSKPLSTSLPAQSMNDEDKAFFRNLEASINHQFEEKKHGKGHKSKKLKRVMTAPPSRKKKIILSSDPNPSISQESQLSDQNLSNSPNNSPQSSFRSFPNSISTPPLPSNQGSFIQSPTSLESPNPDNETPSQQQEKADDDLSPHPRFRQRRVSFARNIFGNNSPQSPETPSSSESLPIVADSPEQQPSSAQDLDATPRRRPLLPPSKLSMVPIPPLSESQHNAERMPSILPNSPQQDSFPSTSANDSQQELFPTQQKASMNSSGEQRASKPVPGARSRSRRLSLAPKMLLSGGESNTQQIPRMTLRSRRLSWARSLQLKKKLDDSDIDMFLCISPYGIPSFLLEKMIKLETEKCQILNPEESK